MLKTFYYTMREHYGNKKTDSLRSTKKFVYRDRRNKRLKGQLYMSGASFADNYITQ